MQDQILSLFTKNRSQRFNQIERSLKLRSNKLAYHLNKLVKQGTLIKNHDVYRLSEDIEEKIPYLSDQVSPLPVVLVQLGDHRQAFLIRRDKRPFKDKLSLPGGRILKGESVLKAAERILKDKYLIKTKANYIQDIFIEHVKKKDKILHSFILFHVKAKTDQDIPLTNLLANRRNMIKSDYLLATSRSDHRSDLKTIYTPSYE